MPSKVGRLSLMLSSYDQQIAYLKQEIVRVQRERLLASIEAARVIKEEGERRSAAKKQGVAA
jgi:hypothetical protein